MKKQNEEKACQHLLADPKVAQLLEKVDRELAEKAARGGCLFCGAKLHHGDYERKPRGGVLGDCRRLSFCCSREGCRRRLTPPSIRFLGRKVYTGVVLVLLSAMTDGITSKALEELRRHVRVDRRTLRHWRRWWLEVVLASGFWKGLRGLFMPPLAEETFVWSLWQRFGADSLEGLERLLRFLSPLSSP